MTLAQKRTIFDAIIIEPIELVISQPHQALISSASVFLVAAEAGILIDGPFNVLLAVGAEWAYLKGLSSGQQVQTRWAPALNWSAVLLVVLYGSLWGLRKFGAISSAPPVWGAVLLTLVHILCIGAVTICSAMVHAAMLAEQKREHDRRQIEQEARARAREEEQRVRQEREATYQFELQQQRDLMQLDLERKYKEQRLEDERRSARRAERMQARMPEASQKRALNAHSESMNTACPKCGAALDRARWMAAKRWGYCAACKEQAV